MDKTILCFRLQRVVVNGIKYDWAPVLSGTVLGLLLFSLYIYEISRDIESEIRLFADDCACYHEINGEKDTLKLQKYIDRLGCWARKMGYEISTRQMQYDTADKKTDSKDTCFIYLREKSSWCNNYK